MKEVRPTTTLLRRAVGLVNGRFFFFRINVFDSTGEHTELWCERTSVEDADWGKRDGYREIAGAHVDTDLDVVKWRMFDGLSSLAQDFFAIPLSLA